LRPDTPLRERIRKLALLNAVNYEGKAQQGPVTGKLLAEIPHLKPEVKNITPIIAEIVEEVNRLDFQEQKRLVETNWPGLLDQGKAEEARELPPLPKAEEYDMIVTRFSPNPDAPIHLGSARAIILCHEYAKTYKGRFLVRFEDTDPKLKKPQLQFYELIKADLRWLDCEPDEYYIQSNRLPIYYEHAERLLTAGQAYVCTCEPEAFKELIVNKKPCPCRDLPPETQLNRWQKMLDGTYTEGEAVVRIKTDLRHPNPAVRDWPALRIINTQAFPHPRVGSKYRVWPLYNLACGVDDHLMGITHIIRGKEHLTNQTRQEFMYRYFGWKYPEAIHYGRLKLSGTSLSKSKIVEGVQKGLYEGWDDPRLATFAALRRRGIQAEAIRRLIIDVGPKTQDVTLSWDNLYAHNRKIVDPQANRCFFVQQPREIVIKGLPEAVTAKIPVHPDYPERGYRKLSVTPVDGTARFWVAADDVETMAKNQVVRFMELFNVTIQSVQAGQVTALFYSRDYEDARKIKAPFVHWLPRGTGLKCQVVLPDASVANGLLEENCKHLAADTVVQFERFGFVRVDRNEENLVTAYYAHR
jgi:glutamyl-tRNA synthetase